jgi:hypothetical protein
MPDPSLSAAIKEAYASAPTDDVVYHTLEFDHPSFPTPVYVVQGFDNITTGAPAVTWTALPFDLRLPEVAPIGPPQLTLTVDNVSRELLDAIDAAAESGQQISVTYRVYLASDLSKAQNDPPFTLKLINITVSATQVSATAALHNFANQRWPRKVYRDEQFPGLT